MADFFEEFGRMVSDVASDITKKTGDTLEIQKIKSNVRSLKRANERDLADTGRSINAYTHTRCGRNTVRS